MQQDNVTKFNGLKVQQNSFTTDPGSLERAENCVISQDNILSKCRGMYEYLRFQAAQVLNCIFNYQNSTFIISQDRLYRSTATKQTAQAKSFSGSAIIVIRKVAHGIANLDYISDFQVNNETFVQAWPKRYADFWGIRQITSVFTSNAARVANLVTVTLINHGLVTGDTISVTSSTLTPTIVAGTKTITVVTSSTFTFADVAADSSGTVTYTMLDALRITADENATATTTTAATDASYLYYTRATGQAVTVTPLPAGVDFSVEISPNKSAYFTTDNGIMKLEREDLPVLKAGIPPGLDLQTSLGFAPGEQIAGPLFPNKNVAYRVLFGRKDANQALVLGAPSQFVIVSNSLFTPSALAYVDATNVLTVTYNAHGLTGTPQIFFYNVVSVGAAVPNGTFLTATITGVNTFTVDFDNVGLGAITNITACQFGVKKSVQLYFTIPSEILSTEYIYRIYRSTQSVDLLTVPPQDYRLVQEANLSASNVTDGYVAFLDAVDDLLIGSNTPLYTNPTQEGESQENSRPPKAIDMTVFRGYTIYANITQYRSLSLNVIAPSLIIDSTIMTIGVQQYALKTNAANEFVGNQLVRGTAARVANLVTVTYVNHAFTTGTIIIVDGSNLVPPIVLGKKTITVTGANNFTFTDTAADSAGNINFEGLQSISGRYLIKIVQVTATVTLSQSVAETARYIVKAINRDPNSLIYAQYVSGETDTPGQMFFESKNVNAATYSIIINNASSSLGFLPIIPLSGTTLSDTQSASSGEIFISKVNEPEAVPRLNSLFIGAQSSRILRCNALRDSVIFYKEDGVYRLNGDSITNFISTPMDTTVICKSRRSVGVLNNAVFALSNQGIVQATDTSVQILSRNDIEPLLSAVLGNPALVESASAGATYESERTYLLATIKPGNTSAQADVSYCYNYLTNKFTTWNRPEDFFGTGYVSKLDDKLLTVPQSTPFKIYKERKDNTKIDYSGQDFCIPVIVSSTADVSVSLGSTTLVITAPYNLTTLIDGKPSPIFPVGTIVTISLANTTISAAFTGGAAHINRVTTVVSVIDEKTFTVNALSSAIANATGLLNFNTGISEVDCSSVVTNGSTIVTVTTPIAHGLLTGNPVTVNWLSSAVQAAFTNATDLTGYRPIIVTSATTFTITATNAAIGTVTNTINISDQRQDKQHVTLITPVTLIPQAGDAIVSSNKIFKSLDVQQASTIQYTIALQSDYVYNSRAFAFLNSAYSTNLKLAPMTKGGVGKLKKFVECQLSFRNDSSCTQLSVNFATDRTVSVASTNWNYRVGTTGTNIGFNGWGRPAWGNFPWGGGISTAKEFYTRPSVSLRTYIPALAAYGTFIQPIIVHRVAGEPLEIQNLALESSVVTQRTTR